MSKATVARSAAFRCPIQRCEDATPSRATLYDHLWIEHGVARDAALLVAARVKRAIVAADARRFVAQQLVETLELSPARVVLAAHNVIDMLPWLEARPERAR
jgi:hypothetical protein